MSKPIVLATRFDRMVRDEPRNGMPAGAMWNLVDWIPGELDAPLAKRGGWSYASQALTTVLAGADDVVCVTYAPFTAGGQIVAVARDTAGPTYRLAQCVSTSSTTDRGATKFPSENPTFYRNKLYLTDSAGSADPHVYDGTSNSAALSGTPPDGSRSCVFKDRLVLANSSGNTNRVWFSAAGDPTSWDTSLRYIDTSGAVTALYALRNAILVFHQYGSERIIGTIPPPGTDMSLQPLSDMGLLDARSLAGTDEFAVFANASGVYLTDGSAVADLTEQGGIKSYWQDVYVAATMASGIMPGGFYRGYYFVCLSGAGTVDTLVCHIQSRRWFRMSNTKALSFGRKMAADGEELYFGDSTEPRVNSMSSCFNPTSTVKNDADGTAVAPILETPYYDLAESKSTVRKVFVNYDLRDAASDNPVLTLSTILSPELTSYTDVVGQSGSAYTLAETTERTRVRRLLRKATFGLGLKLAQSNASATTRLYSLAAEAHGREDSRV